MKTLVVSDLHLGSRLSRDVLSRPGPRRRLLEAFDGHSRVVLLGDVVELWEGRPDKAMAIAEPVLREIGQAAVDHGAPLVVVPGNHDGTLIRAWLRARGERLGLADEVPIDATPRLAQVTSWLASAGAEVTVRYPGLWLRQDVYAHHGHYLDRLLAVPGPVDRFAPDALRRPLRGIPRHRARAWDFERAGGPGFVAIEALLEAALPASLNEVADGVAATARGLALTSAPMAERLPGAPLLAPLSAGLLGYQLRRSGLLAMARVIERLRVQADHVIFGHVHRAGPLASDDIDEWRPLGTSGPRLWNSGSWVYEPLLVAGAAASHPYWPGRAISLSPEPGSNPEVLSLLSDLRSRDLRTA